MRLRGPPTRRRDTADHADDVTTGQLCLPSRHVILRRTASPTRCYVRLMEKGLPVVGFQKLWTKEEAMDTTAREIECNAEEVLFVAVEMGWKKWKAGTTVALGQKPRMKPVGGGDRLPSEGPYGKRAGTS